MIYIMGNTGIANSSVLTIVILGVTHWYLDQIRGNWAACSTHRRRLCLHIFPGTVPSLHSRGLSLRSQAPVRRCKDTFTVPAVGVCHQPTERASRRLKSVATKAENPDQLLQAELQD